MDELLDDLLTEYTVNARRSLRRAKIPAAHLRDAFGGARAQALDTAHLREYIGARPAAGASNGTINRELAALKRAFTLGLQARKILTRPHIPSLVENKPRQGFFEREQFEAGLVRLSDDLKPVAHFAYITGWRIGEILALSWAGVDFTARMVRLEPGTTKNREGRMFPFTPELQALMEHQRARTEAISKETGQIIPHVFHRRGRPIKDFRGAWRSACRAAALPGRIPHDFRRTAVRNLERAGVPRSVAMKMVGHETEAI